MGAGAELERWQLEAKLGLLEDVRATAEESHQILLRNLKRAVQNGTSDPMEQLNRTLSAAGDVRGKREEAVSGLIGLADTGLSESVKKGMSRLLFARRAAELQALKRWKDVEGGLDDRLGSSETSCLQQLGEATRQLVCACREALPLPTDGIDMHKNVTHVGPLEEGWEKCNLPLVSKVLYAERFAGLLPDSVDSCAAGKAALGAIDEELWRLLHGGQQQINKSAEEYPTESR